MLEQIIAQPTWFWFCLGGLLLIAELLGAGGYLLWSGIAAVIMALITWLISEMSWNWQGLLFAIMIILSVLGWRKWLSICNKTMPDEPNQKQHQLIGTKACLITDTNNGYSRIRLADGSWRIYCSQQLLANTEVEVIDIDGITLTVKPVWSNQHDDQPDDQ